MAENISTTVLTVDAGGAISNIKQYKAHIEELKGALLVLEKGTDKYNETAKELRDSQQKLNEVMDIAKGRGDAVEGSYDYLSQTMSKLKREWKATGDAAERARLGEQINEINNQLKGMDASVGVFSRNVGNYAQAYEEAFKNVLGSLQVVDGTLGDIAKTLKQSIPLIKKTTQVATTGLTGIKKVLAGLGIGLLIGALTFLIENFEALRKTVGVTDEKFQNFKNKTLKVFENIVAVVVGAGNAMLQFLLTPIKTFIEVVKGAGTLIKDVFSGNFKAIKNDAKAAGDAVSNALNNGILFKANFGKGQEFARDLIQNIKDGVKKETDSNGAVEVKIDIKPILSRLEEFGLEEIALLKLQSERRKAELTARYEEEKKLLEQNHIDTSKLTAEYMSNMLKAEDDYNNAVYKKQAEADAAQIEQLLANSEEIEDILEGLYDEELMMQQARNIAAAALDAQRAEEEKKLLEERKGYILDFAKSTSSIIGVVADAWETSVKEQIEAGKMSEAEGKRQFEQIKSLQSAVAIINTIAGVVAALTAPSLQGAGPLGWAAAIAQSVALAAAGAAQVAKIQSTTLGTTATQVTSVSTPNLGSIVNEYNPTYTQNITNKTEMDALANAMEKRPLYVSVTDIDNAQTLVRDRNNETTF